MTDPSRLVSHNARMIALNLAAAHGMQKVTSEATMGELQKIARFAIALAGPVVKPPDPGVVAALPNADNFQVIPMFNTEKDVA